MYKDAGLLRMVSSNASNARQKTKSQLRIMSKEPKPSFHCSDVY